MRFATNRMCVKVSFKRTCADLDRGIGGSDPAPPPPPLKNHKTIGSLSNIGIGPSLLDNAFDEPKSLVLAHLIFL